jgi:hypothetical protein
MTLPQSPSPGWYADPHGLSIYRWWDGLAWTAHATDGQSANPSAPQGFYGGEMTGAAMAGRAMTAAPERPAQFRPAPTVSRGRSNQYAFITLGIVAAYSLIAWKAHVYVLGVLPVMMSIRSKSRNEPLAIVAIIAAAVAVLVAVLGFMHR